MLKYNMLIKSLKTSQTFESRKKWDQSTKEGVPITSSFSFLKSSLMKDNKY